MEFKGTKGEWIIEHDDFDGYSVILYEKFGFGTRYIAENIQQGYDDGEADAKLIAAAPELLQACINFVNKCDNGMDRSKNSYSEMKAAIEKALK